MGEAVAVELIHNRVILVRNDKLEIAYKDNYSDGVGDFVSKMLDKDDFIFDNHCFLQTEKGVLFLATRKKSRIWRSIDNGNNWSLVEDGIFINTGYRLVSESNGVIFALSESGSIFSQDNGDTWNYLGNPFPVNNSAIEWSNIS